MGRLLPNGSILFLGRRDDQVKIRGQRIELGEINQCVLRSPLVKDCTTLALNNSGNRSQQLVSFWKPEESEQSSTRLTNEGLKARCSELFGMLEIHLPAYMIPSVLIPINSLPMTTQGKIDKRELESHYCRLDSAALNLFLRDSEDCRVEEEMADQEQRIAAALAEVTGATESSIHRHTSFFNLGLDSVSAISFSRLLKTNGLGQVDVSTILRQSSISLLNSTISPTANGHVVIDEEEQDLLQVFSEEFQGHLKRQAQKEGKLVQTILPCTPLQEAMLAKRDRQSPSAYFNHTRFHLHGDIGSIKKAWTEIIKRHDILRTCFVSTDDVRHSFAQVVLQNFELQWTTTRITSQNLDQEIKRFQADASESKDRLEPPFSIKFVEDVSDGQTILLLSMHHAMYDAEAMRQLLSEVEKFILGFKLEPVVPFKSFLREVASIQDKAVDEFWSKRLADYHPLRWLRHDSNEVAPGAIEVARVEPRFALTWIESECKRQSTSLLPICQTAWVKLMSVYSGVTDICFGNVFSGRTVPIDGIKRLVAPCFNTLPIRAKVRQNMMNKELTTLLHKINTEVLPFQLSSLRRIQNRHGNNGQQLFDTLLILQDIPLKLDERIWTLESETGSMDFPLILEVQPDETSDRLDISLHFDRSYLSTEDAAAILGHYTIFLQNCLQYSSGKVFDSSLLKDRPPSCARRLKLDYFKEINTDHANGHIDRREWSDNEKGIRAVIADLSGAAPHSITLDTTIFQLGLDSINAVQVAAHLRKQGHTVSAADLLEAPSVRQLASLIESQKSKVNNSPALFDFSSFERSHRPTVCQQLNFDENHIEAIRPCTPVQAGMLAEYLHTDGDLYLNHLVVEIDPSITLERLRRAWETVFNNFEMLRTGFFHSSDQKFPFLMITHLSTSVTLPWNEIRNSKYSLLELSKARGRVKMDVLANLHLPAWRISVWVNGDAYYFQFSAHHALYDAQSLNLILDHVTGLLRDQSTKPAVHILPTLGSILNRSSNEDATRDFWTGLSDRYSVTKFPDLNTSRVQSEKSSCLTRRCSTSLEELQLGCKEAGITLQAAGQAAWARILSSYSGEPSVTFGVVLSGRDISDDAREVAFPCLTTLPFPCQVSGTNQNLTQQIMKISAPMVKHQFTPTAKIERWVGAEKGLFDSIFVYQKLPENDSMDMPWQVIDEEAKVNFAVSIELVPVGERDIEFRLTFQEKKVSEKQAKIILGQLDALLRDTVFAPEHDATDMSKIESRLLSALPPRDKIIPSKVELLHEFVEIQARADPNKVALEFASSIRENGVELRRWTYLELNNLGNYYAHLVQSLGAAPGDLVGICFDKCPEAYFAILGVLKAGCAYVALDPGAPIARKDFIVQDSSSRMILCSMSQKQDLKQIERVPVVAVDEPGLLESILSSPHQPTKSISPQDTCYCLYTSGTTGTPKGCEITHKNAVQAMLSFQRLFSGHWDAESRWLQFASFHFDVSVLEQYWSWSVGICVTSAPRDVIFEDIAETISRLQITHIDLTPSLARLLHPDEVPSLCRGVFITGGEQLKQEILDAWGDKAVIYNGYGPTEVTIGCTMYSRVPKNAKPSNIGPQFDNVGSYVLQPNSDIPVLRGAIGELCVSGVLVGRGYLNRPELTEKKFQIIRGTEERIYRTGDLVRLLHDGSFEFLGRIDDQVKLRGQRLEIAEIDQIIKNGAGCEIEVATLVLKHPKQTKEQLVSFVCKSNGRKKPRTQSLQPQDMDRALVSKIRDACVQSLPGYMVPTYILSLSSMPLSPNNKIDGKQLKALYEETTMEDLQKLTSLSEESVNVNPEDIDKVINAIVYQLGLQVSDVKPRSNIFELGLDSISAISFTRALKQAGFDKARASLVMKNPVINSLAIALQETVDDQSATSNARRSAELGIAAFAHRHAFSISESLAIDVKAIEHVAPCTPLQEGMIYRSLYSDRPIYFSAFAFELTPDVDLDCLKEAWKQIQSTAEILRTKFISTPDGYAQVVLKKAQLDWNIVEGNCSESLTTEIEDQSHNFWRENRDLAGILWKVAILVNGSRRTMTLHIFHGLYDGNSLPFILNAVNLAYSTGQSTKQKPSFHEVLAAGPLCETPRAKEFWIKHLSLATKQKLPLKEAVLDVQPVIAFMTIRTPSGFQRTRRQLNVTDQALVHASWISTLVEKFKFTPTLGVVVSGRSIDVEGAENVVGPMFNTIPCIISASTVKTWSDLVQNCHDYNVSSLPFQHTPLRSIMKWCGRNQDDPLFDTLFVYQKEPAPINYLKKPWKPLEVPSEPDYSLAFEAQSNQDSTLSLTIVAQYNVMSSSEAREMLNKFEEYLVTLTLDAESLLPLQDMNPLNGVSSSAVHRYSLEQQSKGPNGISSFTWTKRARHIRKEICTLADVAEEKVGQHVSIFELGLDSIDAIKLSSRLTKSGIKMPVSTIMRLRTIHRMCAEIEEVSYSNLKHDLGKSINSWEEELKKYLQETGYTMDDIEQVLPPTPLQEAMVAEMVCSDYEHYFNHDVLEIEPDVDLDMLADSWRNLVKIHQVLRTSFVEIENLEIPFTYAQIVKTSRELPFYIIDAADNEELQEQIDRQQLCKPTGPQGDLCWVTVVCTPKRSVMILSIAHALYDGWSLGLLRRDMHRLYHKKSVKHKSYRELLGDILNASSEYAARFWEGTLAGVPSTRYPARSLNKTISSTVHRLEKTSQVTLHMVKSFCQSYEITLQALGLTCWSLVLAHNVRNLDVVFGVVLSGRDTDEDVDVVFPTMNTVAVRSFLHGTRSEMTRYMQDVIINVSKYQHYPLRKAKTGASSSALDLFNTLFIYQKRPETEEEGLKPLYRSIGGSSDVEVSTTRTFVWTTTKMLKYPVCVELEIEEESLIWRTACKDHTMDEPGMKSLLDEIDSVLTSILGHSEEPVVEFKGQDTSICGLSPFTLEDSFGGGQAQNDDAEQGLDISDWSPLEEEIRTVLSAVAGISESDIKKNMTLFHLGLDSISAIKASSMLRKRSITIGVSEMLRAATIRNIASAVQSHRSNTLDERPDAKTILQESLRGIDIDRVVKNLRLSASDVEMILPATPGQTFMLSGWQNSEGAIFYPSFHYEVRGEADQPKLDKAWSSLVDQLPVLRTMFFPTNQRNIPFLQIVTKTDQNPIHWISDDNSECGGLQKSRSPFSSPPVSLFVFEDSKKTVLSLRIHHALYDGVSLPKLMQVLEHFYNNPNSRQEPQVNLVDFVIFTHTYSELSQRRSFWKKYLQTGSSQLPTINETPTFERCELYRPHLIDDTTPIDAIIRREGISFQSLFLATYAKVYMNMIKKSNVKEKIQDNIAIGIYLASRSHRLEGLPDLIAPTINLVPLLIRNLSRDDIIDIAREVQSDLHDISSVENSSVSLVEIEEWTGVKVDCFVNILKLPDAESQALVNGYDNNAIRISELDEKEVGNLSVPFNLSKTHIEKARREMNPVGDVYIVSFHFLMALTFNQEHCQR
jgi:amino acid adenylation domain-containing protein